MTAINIFLFIIGFVYCTKCVLANWSTESLNLPDAQITRYLNSFPEEGAKCRSNRSCKYRSVLDSGLCWGYEVGCTKHLGYSNANCPGDHKGWVASKSQQLDTFFKQTDFGFIKQQIQSKKTICKAVKPVSFL